MHNHKRILCLSLAGMMVLGTPTKWPWDDSCEI